MSAETIKLIAKKTNAMRKVAYLILVFGMVLLLTSLPAGLALALAFGLGGKNAAERYLDELKQKRSEKKSE